VEYHGCRVPSPSIIRDCSSTSSSDCADSDSEVSVDDFDEDVRNGCTVVPEGPTAAARLPLAVSSEEELGSGSAVVPGGPTAASRLRLIVASEKERLGRLEADRAAKELHRCQPDSVHHPGQQILLRLRLLVLVLLLIATHRPHPRSSAFFSLSLEVIFNSPKKSYNKLSINGGVTGVKAWPLTPVAD